jgi:hypothetical protein
MDDDPATISTPNLAEADEARRQRRRKAIAELSGSLTGGVYGLGYLDALRLDWPD